MSCKYTLSSECRYPSVSKSGTLNDPSIKSAPECHRMGAAMVIPCGVESVTTIYDGMDQETSQGMCSYKLGTPCKKNSTIPQEGLDEIGQYLNGTYRNSDNCMNRAKQMANMCETNAETLFLAGTGKAHYSGEYTKEGEVTRPNMGCMISMKKCSQVNDLNYNEDKESYIDEESENEEDCLNNAKKYSNLCKDDVMAIYLPNGQGVYTMPSIDKLVKEEITSPTHVESSVGDNVETTTKINALNLILIIVGVIVGLAIVGGIIYFITKRNKN